MTYSETSDSGGLAQRVLVLSESFQQGSEIAASELPFKGARSGLVVVLEAKQRVLECVEGDEVAGREQLALDDGEVDLDLVEPTGMNGSVHEDDVAPSLANSHCGTVAAVRSAVISDPEDASRRTIRFLGHDLVEQSTKGFDSRGGFAPPEDLGTMNVPGGQIGPGAQALVLMFEAHGATGRGGQRGVLTRARLDAGFLVGAEHKIVPAQGFAGPTPFIQVKDTAGFFGKLRITRKDPAAISPGTQRVLTEPAPNGSLSDGGHETSAHDFALDVWNMEAREGQPGLERHLAREGLNADDDAGGKKAWGGPDGRDRRDRRGAPRRIASATCLRSVSGCRSARRSPCFAVPAPRRERPWPSRRRDTVTYISSRSLPRPDALRCSVRSQMGLSSASSPPPHFCEDATTQEKMLSEYVIVFMVASTKEPLGYESGGDYDH